MSQTEGTACVKRVMSVKATYAERVYFLQPKLFSTMVYLSDSLKGVKEVKSKITAWEAGSQIVKGQLGTYSEKSVSDHQRRKRLLMEIFI